MKKQVTKFTKQDKERIENRLLAIFAAALGAEMICLYLFNWFRGATGFVTAARVTTYLLLALFIILIVVLKLKISKFEQTNQTDRAVKYGHWLWVCVAGAICSFLIYPTELIGMIPGIGMTIVKTINGWDYIFGNPISFRITVVMVLVALYTLIAFIYYGILSSKARRASLHKGKH